MRADGPQNFWVSRDVINAQNGNDSKPNQGDRPKEFANACCTSLLHRKQGKQNQQGKGNDGLFKVWGNNLQTFNGGKHRNGRRDHTIAVKQTRAKNADHQQDFSQTRLVFDGL